MRRVENSNDIPHGSADFDIVAKLCILKPVRDRAADSDFAQSWPEHASFDQLYTRPQLQRLVRNPPNNNVRCLSSKPRLIDQHNDFAGNRCDTFCGFNGRLDVAVKKAVGLRLR